MSLRSRAEGISEAVTSMFPTFGGAVDVIAVRQPDGSLTCSDFHVRFGQYQGLLGRKPQRVYLSVNGVSQGPMLRLSRSGVAYFPEDPDSDSDDDQPHSAPLEEDSLVTSNNASDPMSPSGSPPSSTSTNEYSYSSSWRRRWWHGWVRRSKYEREREGNHKDKPLRKGKLDREGSVHSSQSLFAQRRGVCEGHRVSVNIEEGARVQLSVDTTRACGMCSNCGVESSADSLDLLPQAGLELSLCGSLDGLKESDAQAQFERHKISEETFMAKPQRLVEDKRLVCRLGGKMQPWRDFAPALLGAIAFGRPPPCLGIAHKQVKEEEPPKEAATSWRLRPTSEELAQMPVRSGHNELAFTFESPGWGKQELHARLYLWHWTDKLVVSDVDGTITRSDLMGHVMPALGKDWSHAGVAALYRSIANNNYKLVFLSSRGVGLSDRTRQYLTTLRQGEDSLPDGPVIVAPDTLTTAIYREVVRRTPHEFKIEALDKLRRLFPDRSSPFYAGFGNRDTDEMSYEAVKVPRARIFTINPRGEVICRADGRSPTTFTLASINDRIQEVFPPVRGEPPHISDFNSHNFWSLPLDIFESDLCDEPLQL